LRRNKDAQKTEKELLDVIQTVPEDSGGRSSFYIKLGQLFTEYGNYDKAEMYLAKAKEELKKVSYDTDWYNKAREEFELRKSGQYVDILDEIEAAEKKPSEQTK